MEQLKLNTPIAKMMEFVNTCSGTLPAREEAEAFVLILSPFAPHLAEELWERLGHTDTLAYEPWPVFDPGALVDDEITIVIQVRGKLRGRLQVSRDTPRDDILDAARQLEGVAKFLDGQTIRKEVYVPGRLVNFVV